MKRIAGFMAAVTVLLFAGSLALAYADRHLLSASKATWTPANLSGVVISFSTPVVGYVIASRRPANRIGWLILVAGLALGIADICDEYALRAPVAAPGSLPYGRAAEWVSREVGLIPLPCLAFVFLLFPTGRLLSRRWRPAAWFAGSVFTFTVAAALVGATRVSDPFAPFEQAVTPGVYAVTLVAFPAAFLVSGAAVVVRFIRSAGEERLQLKWFAAAAALVVITAIPLILTNSPASVIVYNLALVCLKAAVAVAVLKYRLYDIDIVISRAVMYGSLAAFIAAVYAGLIIGVGALVGGHHGDPLLAAVAAAIIAVAFEPVRRRAGLLANRVVYGRRATSYQVLSDFARRIGGAYSSDEVLPQMARVITAGTGAQRVVIWLRVGDQLRAATSSDESVPAPLLTGISVPAANAPPASVPRLPGADVSVLVMYQGELLGAIAIAMLKTETLRPAGRQLVADIASQAGLVLSNAGLVADLRASRQRLVTAQDEARRRLERNLHDGAQQDLVALAINLSLAASAVETVTEARQMFGELKAEATAALENLRDLARGIYPLLLADLGLAAALSAQAGKSPLPVAVKADGLGRFSQEIEAAVYFCCLEALQNTVKYADATQAAVALRAEHGSLCFSVSDDGTGFDVTRMPMGSGLRNMADQLAALNGHLEICSTPGRGTSITGTLPARAEAIVAER